MLFFDDKPLAPQYTLRNIALAEAAGVKLPSLLDPAKLKRKNAIRWLYVGFIAEYPQLSERQLRKELKPHTTDELFSAVYAALNVDKTDPGSLKRLSFLMEEVN